MMNKLKLSQGLNILSGYKKSHKTSFILKWANNLAKDNKVLYINWAKQESVFIDQLLSMKEKVSPNLVIDSIYEYLDANAFIEIFEKIEDEKFDFIFFDDIIVNSYRNYEDKFFKTCDDVAVALDFIARKLNTKVILTISINQQSKLADTSISHKIRMLSKQIYFLQTQHEVGPGLSNNYEFNIFSMNNEIINQIL